MSDVVLDAEEVRNLVALVRSLQAGLTDEQRYAMWLDIMEGYCRNCGTSYLPCPCERDE